MVISQAPGLSGTPVSGHCANADTSASCARSSAKLTSRTIRTSPAISLVDSRRQTASIASWVVGSVTYPIRSRITELANLAAAFPTRPVIFMDLHQPLRKLDRLPLASYFQHRVPADQFLGFGEWPVDSLDRAVDERNDRTGSAWQQATLINQRAVSSALGRELSHCLEQRRWRRSRRQRLVEPDHRHEAHSCLLTVWTALG